MRRAMRALIPPTEQKSLPQRLRWQPWARSENGPIANSWLSDFSNRRCRTPDWEAGHEVQRELDGRLVDFRTRPSSVARLHCRSDIPASATRAKPVVRQTWQGFSSTSYPRTQSRILRECAPAKTLVFSCSRLFRHLYAHSDGIDQSNSVWMDGETQARHSSLTKTD